MWNRVRQRILSGDNNPPGPQPGQRRRTRHGEADHTRAKGKQYVGTVRRPCVRDLNEHFVSRVPPLFKRQTVQASAT